MASIVVTAVFVCSVIAGRRGDWVAYGMALLLTNTVVMSLYLLLWHRRVCKFITSQIKELQEELLLEIRKLKSIHADPKGQNDADRQ